MTAPTSPADEELVVVRHVVDVGVPLRTRLIAGGAIIVAGLICIFAWGLGANPGDADFGLRTGSDAIELPDIAIPAAPTAIVLGLIIVALGAWHAVRGFSRPQMRWVITAVLLCFVVAFLCWASTGSPGNPLNVPGLLQNTILLGHAARARGAGGHPVRAHRRDQRRDRGAVPGRARSRGRSGRRCRRSLGVGVV